jgi:hypothetical protein
MNRTLKRPMFRKGGQVEDGIMKLAMGGRAKYQGGTTLDPNDPLLKDAQRREALLTKFMGAPSDTKQDLYDLLISGGLNLVGGVGAGDGTMAAIARSFKEPTEKFLAKRPSEEAYLRQLKLAAAQGALSAEDARKLKELEAKQTVAKSFESGTYESQFGKLIDMYSKQAGFDPEETLVFAPKFLELRQLGKEKNFMGSIPKTPKGVQIPDEMIEKNDGSIFYDPEYKMMKIKKNGVLIPLSQSSKGE